MIARRGTLATVNRAAPGQAASKTAVWHMPPRVNLLLRLHQGTPSLVVPVASDPPVKPARAVPAIGRSPLTPSRLLRHLRYADLCLRGGQSAELWLARRYDHAACGLHTAAARPAAFCPALGGCPRRGTRDRERMDRLRGMLHAAVASRDIRAPPAAVWLSPISPYTSKVTPIVWCPISVCIRFGLRVRSMNRLAAASRKEGRPVARRAAVALDAGFELAGLQRRGDDAQHLDPTTLFRKTRSSAPFGRRAATP